MLKLAKAVTVQDTEPTLQDIQEAERNCVINLENDKPGFKIVHLLSMLEFNEEAKKWTIITEIGFNE